jgi:hypothetical protein
LEEEVPIREKSNEAISEETASLSEEGYRRADCSPPEHNLCDSGQVDGQPFQEVSQSLARKISLPPSRENLHWKGGFKLRAIGGMIVVSGAAPLRAAPEISQTA